jgi:CubicO group peptidase (beta-lactamase class C family)
VAKDGKIFWTEAAGLADVENNHSVDIQTHFRIASISKCITAVAIMQLVEKGKIRLDQDARNYIPYFPKKKWKFTVRQLLNHTAGIRNYYKNEFDDIKHYPTLKDAVEIVAKDSLDFKPGTKYMYTTLGYNFLGAIIEKVSGMSYSGYLKKNIFQPAGMYSTYPEFQNELIYNKSRMYARNKYRMLENAPLADLSNKIPGGGISSTVGDLLNFSIALLDGKLIKRETLDSMIVPTVLKNGVKINYGLGFTLGIDHAGRKYFAHEGYEGTSLLVIFPDQKLSSVDLINVRDRNNGTAAFRFASIALKEKAEYPAFQLSDKLMEIELNSGLDSAISKYKQIAQDSSDYYDVSLEEMALFGYDLLSIKRTYDAVRYFKFMVNKYPSKAKPYIGLADAYYKDGNVGLALKNYRLAFKIERTNVYALGMILKITKNK